ncbi:hypothetical protein HR12_20205, partial [Microbacterium sp. SUBG005]
MSDEFDRVRGFYDRFVERGAEVVQPLEKQVWGDFYGEVVDPWGVAWMFTSPPRAGGRKAPRRTELASKELSLRRDVARDCMNDGDERQGAPNGGGRRGLLPRPVRTRQSTLES